MTTILHRRPVPGLALTSNTITFMHSTECETSLYTENGQETDTMIIKELA